MRAEMRRLYQYENENENENENEIPPNPPAKLGGDREPTERAHDSWRKPRPIPGMRRGEQGDSGPTVDESRTRWAG
jgi:hypothetical protein